MGSGLKVFLFLVLALVLAAPLGCSSDESDEMEEPAGDDGDGNADEGDVDGAAGDGATGDGDDGGDSGGVEPLDPEEIAEQVLDEDGNSLHMGDCADLDSGYVGDDKCLRVPDPDVGFQIHVGPESYSDEDVAAWLMQPGEESSECFFFKTENTEELWFQSWELSGRDGTHHIINSALFEAGPDGWGVCMDAGLGTSNNVAGILPGASKAHMPPAPIAPENRGLGASLPAETPVQADMHYFNFNAPCDDKSCLVLREFWINIYYVKPELVTEESTGIRGMGGLNWLLQPIQPGTMETYRYECPIEADGRIVRLIGHTHKHGVRETAWLKRPGDATDDDMLKVFEQYDYLEPQIFEYNSVTTNPEFSDNGPGAYSGILEVQAGDALVWECEVHNTSDSPLRYTNEVETGEMCNIWGQAVGPDMSGCVNFF